MSKTEDGGGAFPRTWTESWGGELANESERGMSLRDWFAGQALMGWLANRPNAAELPTDVSVPEVLARLSYGLADAMIAERQKERS